MTISAGLRADPWFLTVIAAGPFAASSLLLFALWVQLPVVRADSWQTSLWLVLLYPTAEELVFRGVMQPNLNQINTLQQTRLGFSLANWITSIVFVLAHFCWQATVWTLLILLPSLLFGWLRDRYQSVLPAIGLHCYYNGLFLLMTTLLIQP